jgi:hypothetical protein
MADRESVAILRQVLDEIRSHVDMQHALTDAMVEAQWQLQFVPHRAEMDVFPDFQKPLQHDGEEDARNTDIETEPLLPR